MAHRSARELAIAALTEWREGQRFADAAIQELLARSALGGSDRGFAVELFYGVLRNLTLLDFWIGLLRSERIDDEARDLLRLGLYQLLLLRTPGHAAVFETVALAPKRKRALVNAILRASQRRAGELDAAAAAAPIATRFSHPQFLVERWGGAFGDSAATALCEWDNTPAPIYARIHQLNTTREQFLAANTGSEPLADWPRFVRLASVPLDALARGECYIQDPSTSVACELLAPRAGETVLDACAAPGGKTGLLAEMMQNEGRVLACDRDERRVQTLQENLDRLRVVNATPVRHDWRSGPLAGDHADSCFDKILLDAPCTNTGVMRRRVDVRWRLHPQDFQRMPNEQLQILDAVLRHLKPGGSIVYSTCSLEAEENEQLVSRAVEAFRFLRLDEQRSVLPFRDGFDGAFAAKLTRVG